MFFFVIIQNRVMISIVKILFLIICIIILYLKKIQIMHHAVNLKKNVITEKKKQSKTRSFEPRTFPTRGKKLPAEPQQLLRT